MSALRTLLCCVVVVATTASAQASMTYRLFNHDDGGAAPPPYGLRLDELIDVNAGQHDVFTFDFEYNDGMGMSSDVRMKITADKVHIFGKAFGGLDVGASYDPNYSGWIDIDFWYRENVTYPAGYPGPPAQPIFLEVTGEHSDNEGMITMLTAIGTLGVGDEVDLVDEQGSHSYSFRLADDHRGHDGLSGYGWLNHSGDPHVYASDWLFTARKTFDDSGEVPEPATFVVWTALGLCGLGYVRLRKRRS